MTDVLLVLILVVLVAQNWPAWAGRLGPRVDYWRKQRRLRRGQR